MVGPLKNDTATSICPFNTSFNTEQGQGNEKEHNSPFKTMNYLVNMMNLL